MIIKRHTLTNALRSAAERFDGFAAQFSAEELDRLPNLSRIAAQFLQQAREAREIADQVDEGAKIIFEED